MTKPNALTDAVARMDRKVQSFPNEDRRLYDCPHCLDTGWTWLDNSTVRRCPQGCEIPVRRGEQKPKRRARA